MNKFNANLKPVMHLQKGVVLFFSLIALVAMSLAAVALIRSVDTNSMIAGNLAFKQSAMSSADRGVEAAIAWLDDPARTIAYLRNNVPASGYYASIGADAKTLVDASGVAGAIANPDAQGNTITYVVQRMCRNTGNPTDTNCVFGPEKESGNDKSCELCTPSSTKRLMYRITAKVVGPKNTVSYIQTFAL